LWVSLFELFLFVFDVDVFDIGRSDGIQISLCAKRVLFTIDITLMGYIPQTSTKYEILIGGYSLYGNLNKKKKKKLFIKKKKKKKKKQLIKIKNSKINYRKINFSILYLLLVS